MEEEKLVRKLRQGDRFALNRAMDTYTPYLSVVVWHTMGPNARSEDVEEVVSDAFLTLWQHREELKPEKGPKAWLAAVTRNKAIDRLRLSPPPSLPLETINASPDPSPDQEIEQQAFALQLWTAVEALGPPDNALVFRFYYQGEKLKVISADLGLTHSAAKVRLHRARQKLKLILTKGGSADGPNE